MERLLPDWKQAHEHIVRLGKEKCRYDFEEARWMLVAYRTKVHEHLGYGGFGEYAERYLGYSPRAAWDRLRVAQAFEELNQIPSALGGARISWTVARELTRVAVPETEQAWLDAAKDKPVREVERLVSGRQKGDGPTTPKREKDAPSVLRYEVRAETWAMMRDAKAKLTEQTGQHLSDDEFLQALARGELEGGADEGRSPYQVKVTQCSDCRRSWVNAAGEDKELDEATGTRVACDAQDIGRVDGPGAEQPDASARMGSDKPARASQSVPPAIRRMVLERFDRTCAVPGCRHRADELHHNCPRAEGGKHDPEHLVPLCARHHAAHHDGRLRIDGSASAGFRFFHADGTPYGQPPSAQLSDVCSKTQTCLRNMGFKETEARRAVEAVRAHVGSEPTLEQMLQAALRGMPSPGQASQLRERGVEYVRLDAA